jgi:hypothetical protein
VEISPGAASGGCYFNRSFLHFCFSLGGLVPHTGYIS